MIDVSESSKVSEFFDDLSQFLNVEVMMDEILGSEQVQLYCEDKCIEYPPDLSDPAVKEMLTEKVGDIYKQYLKNSKDEISEYYNQLKREKLELYISSNDKDSAEMFVEELKEESGLLDKLVIFKLGSGVYNLLSETEEISAYSSCLVSSYVTEAFSFLYEEIFGLIYEAEREIGYIPSPEFLEDLERENLKGYLMLLYKEGSVEKGRINPSDYRKLEAMNMVSVGEKGRVFLKDKADHICRTVYS
ncbi:MAG: hypothetical protein U9O53_06675 [archaeon]|nr:hypothetical protein [archaeon]